MKKKQTHFIRASFAILAFVMLGYVVKFYPEAIKGFDSSIQTIVRGHLPAGLTSFFKVITSLGSEIGIFIYTLALAIFFYFKKSWKMEGYLLFGNLVLMGILSTLFKYLYNRSRPNLTYLIPRPMGPSFPSWHAASTLIVAMSLAVIIGQRLANKSLVRLLQALLILLAFLTALSRIYLGVHYPTDILAAWLLAIAQLSFVYPFYDQKRFEWRFKSKQK